MFRFAIPVVSIGAFVTTAVAQVDPPDGCEGLLGESLICSVLPDPQEDCDVCGHGWVAYCAECPYDLETCPVPLMCWKCIEDPNNPPLLVCVVDNGVCACPPGWNTGLCPACAVPEACWVCTQLIDVCPSPPRVGSVLTFQMNISSSCSTVADDYVWSICQGSGLVTPQDPLSGPGASDTLRVLATGSGTLTVIGYRADESNGCCGGPYRVERTVTIAPYCAGDVNGDGTVNVVDLTEVNNSWGTPGCGGADCCRADLDGDGDVDNVDMLIVMNNWGPC